MRKEHDELLANLRTSYENDEDKWRAEKAAFERESQELRDEVEGSRQVSNSRKIVM